MYLPDIYDFKMGDTGVTRIMLGSEQVWPIYRRIIEKLEDLDQIPDDGYIECVLMNDDVHCNKMGRYGTGYQDDYNFQYGPNGQLTNSSVTNLSDWIIFRVSKPSYWPGTFVMQAVPKDGTQEKGCLELNQYLAYAGMGAWGFGQDGLIYPSDYEGNLDTNTGYIVQSSTHLQEQANKYAVRVGQLTTDPPMFLYVLSNI